MAKEMPKLITYKIQGGAPFKMEIPSNPLIEHDGSVTVGHLYVSEGEVGAIMLSIREFGVTLQFWEMTKQTPEQEKERKLLSGSMRSETVFPNKTCPECAWFDPLTKHLCGLTDWPQESIEVLMQKSHHKHYSEICPTPQIWKL